MPVSPAILRIAFAVRNVKTACAVFESLFGLEFTPSKSASEEVESYEAHLPGGQPILEVVRPVDDEGAIARFIRKRGEGIHHLTIAVPDLEEALRVATEEGRRVIRTGSYYRRPDGGTFTEAFLHPKDATGVLVHLVEKP